MSDRPLILAFNTAAATCAAALVQDDRILIHRSEAMKRGQAERLVPMLEQILSEQNVSWSRIDGLAVCTGPGNFTGIRLSVATARGLSLALQVPAIGVTGFESNIYGISGPVLALTSNGRGETWGQVFVEGHPVSVPTADLDRLNLPNGCVCAGAGTAETARRLKLTHFELKAGDDLLGAARVASRRLGQVPDMPVPFYVRAADAAPSSDKPPIILDDV